MSHCLARPMVFTTRPRRHQRLLSQESLRKMLAWPPAIQKYYPCPWGAAFHTTSAISVLLPGRWPARRPSPLNIPRSFWETRFTINFEKGFFFAKGPPRGGSREGGLAGPVRLNLKVSGSAPPIPVHSEYPSWSSYHAAVDKWNNFASVDNKLEGSENRLT